jgi:hypothetical protein
LKEYFSETNNKIKNSVKRKSSNKNHSWFDFYPSAVLCVQLREKVTMGVGSKLIRILLFSEQL